MSEIIAQPPWRWKETANCVTADPEYFYPEKPAQWEVDLISLAFCESCPAFRECLNWALAANEEGIWAGTTKEQRRPILKALRSSGQDPKIPDDVDLKAYQRKYSPLVLPSEEEPAK